jgi:hypothetical protein
MKTKIEVLVGEDHVGYFYMQKAEEGHTTFIDNIIKAAAKNPTIIELTDLPETPEVGMRFDGENFIAVPETVFYQNSIDPSQKVFGFVVDGTLEAIQHLIVSGMQHFIAAYRSNPTFKVSEIEDDQW